jgi:hypothetical protein
MNLLFPVFSGLLSNVPQRPGPEGHWDKAAAAGRRETGLDRTYLVLYPNEYQNHAPQTTDRWLSPNSPNLKRALCRVGASGPYGLVLRVLGASERGCGLGFPIDKLAHRSKSTMEMACECFTRQL